MKKKPLIITSTAFLLFGLAGCGTTTKTTTSNQTVFVQKKEMKVQVSGTGTILPTSTQSIVPSSSGEIQTVYVQEGQTVKKGDPLVALKGQDQSQQLSHEQITLDKLNLQLQQEQQSLANENANLTIISPISGTVSAVNFETGDSVQQGSVAFTVVDSSGNKQDVKTKISGTISSISVSKGSTISEGNTLATLSSDGQIENQIKSTNLDIQDAQNTIASLQSQSSPSVVTANMDGIVSGLTATVGESVQQSTALGNIINDSQMQLSVNVDELDVPQVSIGQTVDVSVDAFPNKTFTGKVTSIATQGVTTNGVSTFAVAVALDNPSGIRAGMSATANIIVADKKDALTVPIEAVHERNGSDFVTVEDGQNQMQSVQVKEGLHNDSYMEIISGLSEGDKVVIPVYNSSSTSNTKGIFGGFGGGANRSFGGGNANRNNNSGGNGTKATSSSNSSNASKSSQSTSSNGGNN